MLWDEITYSFQNFNGATVEIGELIRDFIPHFIHRIESITLTTVSVNWGCVFFFFF